MQNIRTFLGSAAAAGVGAVVGGTLPIPTFHAHAQGQVHGRAFLLSIAWLAVAGSPLAAQIPQNWNAFSVDIAVRHYEVAADGAPTGSNSSAVTYRLEQVEQRGKWQTTMTLITGDKPMVKFPDGQRTVDSRVISRIEMDNDGTPPRIFLKNGKPMPPIPPAAIPNAMDNLRKTQPNVAAILSATPAGIPQRGREWVEELVIRPGDAAKRRNALVARVGSSIGKDRGYDRYVTFKNGNRTDLLMHPSAAVLVGIDRSREGVLLEHTTITYAEGADGSLMKRSVRNERRIDDQRRQVTETEFSNITFARREK